MRLSKFNVGALFALLVALMCVGPVSEALAKRRKPKVKTFVYETETGTAGGRVMVMVPPKGRQPMQIFIAFVGPRADGKELRLDLPIGRQVETRWASDGTLAAANQTVTDNGLDDPVSVMIPAKGTVTDPNPVHNPGENVTVEFKYIVDEDHPTAAITKIVLQKNFNGPIAKTFNEVIMPEGKFTFRIEPGNYRIKVYNEFGQYYDTFGDADVTWNSNKTYFYPEPERSAVVAGNFVDNPNVQAGAVIRKISFVPLSVPGVPDFQTQEVTTYGGAAQAFRTELFPGTYRIETYDERETPFFSDEKTFAAGEEVFLELER